MCYTIIVPRDKGKSRRQGQNYVSHPRDGNLEKNERNPKNLLTNSQTYGTINTEKRERNS